jgi:hypothetical protein
MPYTFPLKGKIYYEKAYTGIIKNTLPKKLWITGGLLE